jgi:hypothetical protein
VSGGNGITASFTVIFTVYPEGTTPPAPAYGIALTVTVTNITGILTVALLGNDQNSFTMPQALIMPQAEARRMIPSHNFTHKNYQGKLHPP